MDYLSWYADCLRQDHKGRPYGLWWPPTLDGCNLFVSIVSLLHRSRDMPTSSFAAAWDRVLVGWSVASASPVMAERCPRTGSAPSWVGLPGKRARLLWRNSFKTSRNKGPLRTSGALPHRAFNANPRSRLCYQRTLKPRRMGAYLRHKDWQPLG